jgi:hypothetical protein
MIVKERAKMDKISRLFYLLYQSDDEEVKDIAIQLLNGDVLLKDIKKTKNIKAYIAATEAKINKVDTHEVALFVEKFMLMEV